MDPKVQCGMCVYHNSLMETVDGHVRTSLWADCLSPLYDWLFFGALDLFLLDFVGVKMLLFCKDNILRNRQDKLHSDGLFCKHVYRRELIVHV